MRERKVRCDRPTWRVRPIGDITVVIVKGVAIYNELTIPFLYMPSRDLGVISTSLYRFKGPFGTQWEIISVMDQLSPWR